MSSDKIRKSLSKYSKLFRNIITTRNIRDHLAQNSHFTNKKIEIEKLNVLLKVTNHGQLSATWPNLVKAEKNLPFPLKHNLLPSSK